MTKLVPWCSCISGTGFLWSNITIVIMFDDDVPISYDDNDHLRKPFYNSVALLGI